MESSFSPSFGWQFFALLIPVKLGIIRLFIVLFAFKTATSPEICQLHFIFPHPHFIQCCDIEYHPCTKLYLNLSALDSIMNSNRVIYMPLETYSRDILAIKASCYSKGVTLSCLMCSVYRPVSSK